jgi:tRNA-Thr(GGU) m(6)t(6)A37 methyltransferase TsaA
LPPFGRAALRGARDAPDFARSTVKFDAATAIGDSTVRLPIEDRIRANYAHLTRADQKGTAADVRRSRPVNVTPIGIIRTDHPRAAGTPIQPYHAVGSTGTVEIYAPFVEGLRDLEGFDRIWLIYWFHRAAPAQLQVVPFRDNVARGVFATRAPARPNPIGMSSVRLLAVERHLLRIADVDIVDGTPLIDIKPNIPLYDTYPISACGWFDAAADGPSVADARFERAEVERNSPNT